MARNIVEGDVVRISGIVRKVETSKAGSWTAKVAIEGVQGWKENLLTLTPNQVAAVGVVVVPSVFKLEEVVTHKISGGKGYVVGSSGVGGYRVAWVTSNAAEVASLEFGMAAADLLLPYWPDEEEPVEPVAGEVPAEPLVVEPAPAPVAPVEPAPVVDDKTKPVAP